ncbi:MAG TPA: hypothetical protein VGL81_08955 [Polyangiaceae bacterium]|jgi:hypothetical protein
MTMGRRALLAVLVLPVACGARTALLLPGEGAGGGGSGGSGGGGATPLAVVCHAALQDGAPTPTQGFCTTRANQASVVGPEAPVVAWAVAPFPIPSPEDYLPAEMVVDASGRAYVAINASPMAPTGTANQLFAVDADGSVAWRTTFDSTIGPLSIGRDGNLWFSLYLIADGNDFPASSNVTGLSPDGTPVVTIAPSVRSFSLMAIASDGSFFVGSDGLARIAPDGTVLWQNDYGQFGTSMVVGPDDDVVTDENVFDSAGTSVSTSPPGEVLAVDSHDTVFGLTANPGGSVAITTTDPSYANGIVLEGPASNIDAYELALAGDGSALVLLADEASAPGLTKAHLQILAVEPWGGHVRWTTPLDVTLPYDPANLTTHYGLFVDAAGTVVVTAGTVMGLDLASGAVLWTLQPANATSCLRPAVLGTGRSIIATQCDGTVFLARDP